MEPYAVSCDHKFIGGPRCAKCGWEPPQRRMPGPLPSPPHAASSAANERTDLSRPMDAFDLEWVSKQLAAQGLHVVSAADKRVLDALGKASLADLQFLPGLDGALDAVYYAELARREQKP